MKASYSVRRPTYVDAAGNKRKCDTLQIVFHDLYNRRRYLSGFATERETHKLADRVIQLIHNRRTGSPLSDEMRKWMESISPDFRSRLAKLGIVDEGADSVDRPLIEHLDGRLDASGQVVEPGFQQALAARGNTSHHVSTTVRRTRDIMENCGFVFWRDLIAPGAVTRVEVWLGKRRADGKITGKSLNYYIRDMRSFCRWLCKSGRVPSVAMDAMAPVKNADVDSERRRALSVEEMRWLISKTSAGSERQRLSGTERAFLYRFAFETGMRSGQIRALIMTDFDLRSTPPTVTSKAGNVKRRRAHTQTLRPGTAAILTEMFKTRMPTDLAIKMPKNATHMAEMLRLDLAETRRDWIDAGATDEEKVERGKTDFLAAVNHSGERAVFYSTRHGHGTALAEAGVPEKDIAASMHHASRTTTARYLHSDQQSVSKAIAAMPDLLYLPGVIAKGDDGSAKESLPRDCPELAQLATLGGKTGVQTNLLQNPGFGSKIGEKPNIGSKIEQRPLGGIGRRDGFKIHSNPQKISEIKAKTKIHRCHCPVTAQTLHPKMIVWPH
jgi:integrase